jgi:hypothetical protein
MKHTIFLGGMFFAMNAVAGQEKMVTITNKSSHVVQIKYRDQDCDVREMLLVHKSLFLVLEKSSVIITDPTVNKSYKLILKKYDSNYIIESQKNRPGGGLNIFECNQYLSQFSP